MNNSDDDYPAKVNMSEVDTWAAREETAILRRNRVDAFVTYLKMQGHHSLGSDIEKAMKKINDGVDTAIKAFEEAETTTDAHTKDRAIETIKKEVRKLQKLREGLNPWINTPKFKEKDILQELRKLIERLMSRWKLLEKSIKIKEYSQLSLAGFIKPINPVVKDRNELKTWLTSVIDRIKHQIDLLESDICTLLGKKGKRGDKDTELETFKGFITRHKHHLNKLEKLLRMLHNTTVESKEIVSFMSQVNQIKDDIEYYLEANREPDYQENEFVYDEIDGLDQPLSSMVATPSPRVDGDGRHILDSRDNVTPTDTVDVNSSFSPSESNKSAQKTTSREAGLARMLKAPYRKKSHKYTPSQKNQPLFVPEMWIQNSSGKYVRSEKNNSRAKDTNLQSIQKTRPRPNPKTAPFNYPKPKTQNPYAHFNLKRRPSARANTHNSWMPKPIPGQWGNTPGMGRYYNTAAKSTSKSGGHNVPLPVLSLTRMAQPDAWTSLVDTKNKLAALMRPDPKPKPKKGHLWARKTSSTQAVRTISASGLRAAPGYGGAPYRAHGYRTAPGYGAQPYRAPGYRAVPGYRGAHGYRGERGYRGRGYRAPAYRGVSAYRGTPQGIPVLQRFPTPLGPVFTPPCTPSSFPVTTPTAASFPTPRASPFQAPGISPFPIPRVSPFLTPRAPPFPMTRDQPFPTARAPPFPTPRSPPLPTPKASPLPTPTTSPFPTPRAPLLPTPRAPLLPTPMAQLLPTPRAPLLLTPRAPLLATPRAPLLATPRAPLLATPRAPLLSTPRAPLLATPKAPLLATPKAPLLTTPRDSPLSTPRAAPVPIPAFTLTPTTEVAFEPKACATEDLAKEQVITKQTFPKIPEFSFSRSQAINLGPLPQIQSLLWPKYLDSEPDPEREVTSGKAGEIVETKCDQSKGDKKKSRFPRITAKDMELYKKYKTLDIQVIKDEINCIPKYCFNDSGRIPLVKDPFPMEAPTLKEVAKVLPMAFSKIVSPPKSPLEFKNEAVLMPPRKENERGSVKTRSWKVEDLRIAFKPAHFPTKVEKEDDSKESSKLGAPKAGSSTCGYKPLIEIFIDGVGYSPAKETVYNFHIPGVYPPNVIRKSKHTQTVDTNSQTSTMNAARILSTTPAFNRIPTIPPGFECIPPVPSEFERILSVPPGFYKIPPVPPGFESIPPLPPGFEMIPPGFERIPPGFERIHRHPSSFSESESSEPATSARGSDSPLILYRTRST